MIAHVIFLGSTSFSFTIVSKVVSTGTTRTLYALRLLRSFLILSLNKKRKILFFLRREEREGEREREGGSTKKDQKVIFSF